MKQRKPDILQNDVDVNKKGNKYSFMSVFNNLFGYILGISIGIIFSYYIYSIHEAQLWFSNIRKIEQEISLRTESGLYYSYYKEILQKKNLINGIISLTNDTRTEWPRSINLLERFNIYQEIILASLYTFYNFNLSPMLFYVYSCFSFSGLQIFSIFCLSWVISKNYTYSILTSAWLFYNLDDSTRAFFTVNLREIFSLPFLFLSTSFLIQYLTLKKSYYALFYTISIFLFSLFWQFNQFLLIFQSLTLLVILLVEKSYKNEIKKIICLQCLAFLLTTGAQFFQKMLIGSISMSLNISILLILYISDKITYSLNRFLSIPIHLISILLTTYFINNFVKFQLNITDDTHIWTFVKAKLGYSYEDVTFETALYLCHGAFANLDKEFFYRTTKSGVLPLYVCSVIIEICMTIYNFIKHKKYINDYNVGRIFLIIQSIPTGVMAITTLRMKYVWFPQIAVLGSDAIKKLTPFLGKIPTYVIVISVAGSLFHLQYQVYEKQMDNLQEFYDPDTVDLMLWIGTTKRVSSFTGSMQLMAGVKACVGRNILNHPHFEDKWLRERTRKLYSIYGRYSIKKVHKIMLEEKADYIIVEDSICLAPSTGCSINDIVDMSAGILPDNGIQKFGKNARVFKKHERFCEAIKNQNSTDVTNYFYLEFSNPTFNVYKVIPLDDDY
uniref:C-mannosyltransferase n=1 Tax=Strongyloides papillosus TaxID=174720 RepID=A0A0N5C083_STREA